MKIAAGIAAFALAGGPGRMARPPDFDEVDERLQDLLREEMAAEDTGAIAAPGPSRGADLHARTGSAAG